MSHIAFRQHLGFIIALGLSATGCAIALLLRPDLAAGIATVVFFWAYLAFLTRHFRLLTASYLKRNARREDVPASVTLSVALIATLVAMTELFVALNGKDIPAIPFALAFASVAGGWLTIHAMSAIHYAHAYWQKHATDKDGEQTYRRGLDFPGTPDPSGYDFLYFAFVIGMTAQTADVAITSTRMRTLVLRHSVIAFLFNTVLVAAAVNAAVALAG